MPSGFGRMPGRKPKQKQGIGGALTGLLSKAGRAKPQTGSSTGKKAGGLAAVAAAAGVAFRNRDKLKSMLDSRRGDQRETPVAPPAQRTTEPTAL